jgi:hypothetical protein
MAGKKGQEGAQGQVEPDTAALQLEAIQERDLASGQRSVDRSRVRGLSPAERLPLIVDGRVSSTTLSNAT